MKHWSALLVLSVLLGCRSEPKSSHGTGPSPDSALKNAAAVTGSHEDGGSSTLSNSADSSAISPVIELSVDGDVSPSLIDEEGRHSGWEGHKVEDIPGCTVDVLESEVAEPTYCGFRWENGGSGTFQLVLRPRTDGSVSIAVRAISSVGTRCEKLASADLKAEVLATWTVQVEAMKTHCLAELVRINQR